MQFPVTFELASHRILAHTVFESLGYFTGSQLFRVQRGRQGDFLLFWQRLVLIAAMIAGAVVGSKALGWLENPARSSPLLGGKTIVGGLLGGLLAVEGMKKAMGVERRTGDLYALPIAAGIAIGRVGCFLQGLSDETQGNPTSLPWGVDFGDGIPRHPAPLYEIAFLAFLLMPWLSRLQARPHREGDVFRAFMIGYLGYRLLADFAKPHAFAVLGMTAIQWACLAALLYYGRSTLPLMRKEPLPHG